jgi:hypothetical protein
VGAVAEHVRVTAIDFVEVFDQGGAAFEIGMVGVDASIDDVRASAFTRRGVVEIVGNALLGMADPT